MKKFLFTIFSIGALYGCLDEQLVDVMSSPPRIVIDGLVSNIEGESFITIGWTSSVNAVCRDSFGNVIRCEPTIDQGPYKVIGVVVITEMNTGRKIEMPFKMNDKKGMVLIKPAMKGTVGNTYKLSIELLYDGETEIYSAMARMLSTPVITEITYEIRQGDVGKKGGLVPLISFEEPVEDNYYLFQLCSVDQNIFYCGNSRVWGYSLIPDTFLPSHVEKLSIDDGASIAKYADFYPSPEPGSGAHVRMYSVDKLTYEYYKSLIDQFNNDGGAFSPTPGTPKGNISGNSIGLFRAVEESSATVYY